MLQGFSKICVRSFKGRVLLATALVLHFPMTALGRRVERKTSRGHIDEHTLAGESTDDDSTSSGSFPGQKKGISSSAAKAPPVSLGETSPQRRRGRPMGSFKLKSSPPKPVFLVDGQRRRPGRPAGSIKKPQQPKERRENRVVEADAISAEGHSSNHFQRAVRSSETASIPDISQSNAALQRMQRMLSPGDHCPCYTHDFSLLSLAEMHRLAAACAAAAIWRLSEAPRYAGYAAQLAARAEELERRVSDGYDAVS
jgi:hypothetical protein